MQKGAKRILGALIVLIMVLSILPASVFATGETTDVLEGWSITLSDDIGVKFHLNSEGYTVTATVDGAEVEPTVSGKVVTVNVAAAQMTAPVVLTVKDGENTVYAGEYSVRQYAETILTGEYDEYVKDIVKQMLNYGAAAQKYFDYNTGSLANAGYELENNTVVLPDAPEPTVVDTLDGIELYGMSLVLRNKLAARFYFTVGEGVDINSFTFNQGKLGRKHGMHFVEIDGINPQDLAKEITLNVNDSALSVTYSPLNYIVNMYKKDNSSDELKSLVQALYGYHQEAVHYDSVVPVTGLKNHSSGWSADGIYISHNDHKATYNSDWTVEYKPLSENAIKLVRGGETFSVGAPGQGTLVVYSSTEMYLKTAAWTISGDKLPLVDGDQLIIEGEFKHEASGDILNIEKTTIEIVNGGLGINAISVGMLQASPNDAGDSGIYFQTAEVNDAPWDDWNTYYDSQSVDNIKLIRGGETISVGLTDKNTICKFGENDYYLRLENHTIGDYAPYTTDDVFIVEGLFTHKVSMTTLNIATTYIYHNGASWVFATGLPTVYEAGVLQTHEVGMQGNGIHFRTAANEAPFNGDWSLEYTQTSADNIKLIRNGETVSIGIEDRPLLVKINECDYYLKLENWTIGEYGLDSTNPITTDDVLIIEGDFFYAAENVILNITKSYVYYNGSAWVFTSSLPTVYNAGVLKTHEAGMSGNGIYFRTEANDAPFNGDWSLEYKQTSVDNIKLIRDGVTTSIGIVDRPMFVRVNEIDHYLKLENWTIGDYAPITTDDVLIIEGNFFYAAENVILNITRSYVYYDGTAWVCSAEEPSDAVVVSGGNLDAA